MNYLFRGLFGAYALLICLAMLPVGTLMIIATPGLGNRRRMAKWLARVLLGLLGAGPRIEGLPGLPNGACVVVANHCSYLDGVLLKAVLPPRFSFVIKKEARRIPMGGFMLHRLGSEFVTRDNDHAGARDARRILRAAAEGQALGFFPEGTFMPEPGLRPFRLGAFLTAARAGLPVIPIAIHGSRRMLPSGSWLPRPGRLSVKILAAITPTGNDRDAAMLLRDQARRQILANIDEPDLAGGSETQGTNPRRELSARPDL
ncbi:MAG: 1-acyl-sn-glycerol-3-phosphate acyltransferase [Gammaproteobacteria bacterium]|nr:1-acyl-sn-glycerol-3-phosphate acyltransferase [Gammaproteobacteria bacterium]